MNTQPIGHSEHKKPLALSGACTERSRSVEGGESHHLGSQETLRFAQV